MLFMWTASWDFYFYALKLQLYTMFLIRFLGCYAVLNKLFVYVASAGVSLGSQAAMARLVCVTVITNLGKVWRKQTATEEENVAWLKVREGGQLSPAAFSSSSAQVIPFKAIESAQTIEFQCAWKQRPLSAHSADCWAAALLKWHLPRGWCPACFFLCHILDLRGCSLTMHSSNHVFNVQSQLHLLSLNQFRVLTDGHHHSYQPTFHGSPEMGLDFALVELLTQTLWVCQHLCASPASICEVLLSF